MPQGESNPQRSTGISSGGLNPDLFEWALAQQAPIADAIQRDATSEAQPRRTCVAVRGTCHAQHDVLDHLLHRPGEVHLSLCHRCVRGTPGTAEQPSETLARHCQPVHEFEVFKVEPDAAIIEHLDEMITNGVDVPRLAIRRETHDLVLALVDFESGEVGKG